MASQKEKNGIRVSLIFLALGSLFITLGVAIIFLTFTPLAKEEIRYAARHAPSPMTPIDTSFGIVIPKLGANAHVIPNVDPYDSNQYQIALTRGVAHARGTAYPGTNGNVFLFAHSSENFYLAMRYNAVFYLLSKLTTGDSIDLYFRDKKFTYRVTDKKFVEPKNVEYLSFQPGTPTLTLMTCWPPGTTLKRLLIVAALDNEN